MSGSGALRVSHVHVRRTPGIPHGFEIGGLCGGVNVIHGPNGSGKTSTLRAIEAALWARDADHTGLSVAARYELDGRTYVVDVDAGRVRVQRDGLDDHPPQLPAPELRHRYRLSLHELLAAEEGGCEFAAAIARESAGGYDLAAAAGALGFEWRVSRPQKVMQALRNARDALRQARERQASLREDEARLQELQARCAAARGAGEHALVLERAIAHAEALATREAARERLAAFPEVLAGLHGDELERARALRDAVAAAEREVREARAALHEAEREANEALPHGVPPDTLVPTLREEATRLALLEASVAEAARRATEAATRLDVVRQQLGDGMDDDRLAVLDCTGVGALASLARELEELHARLLATEAELRRADGDEPAASAERLRDGVRILGQWLQEAAGRPERERALRRATVALWVLALAGALGWGLLAAVWQPVAVVAVFGLLAAAALLGRRAPAATDGRASRERDFARLGLPQPERWTEDAVARAYDALQEELARAKVSARLADWRRDAAARREALVAERTELAERIADVVAGIGLPPGSDVRQLALLVGRIGAWQQAFAELQGARAAEASAKEQLARALAEAAARVRPFGYAAPPSSAALGGIATALAAAVEAHARAMDRQAAARRDLERAEAAVQQASADLAAIYERTGLDIGDERGLAALCAQCGAYREAVQAVRDAEGAVTAARLALGAAADADPSLLDEDVASLRARHDDAVRLASEHDALLQQATGIRARVEAAKQGHDAEGARAEVAALEDVLREHRERDLRAMVGDALVRHLQRVTRDQHRPEVFHRAREIFAHVTRGQYTLQLDDRDGGREAAFRAVDTERDEGFALDQLSAGTRVQLLLAVRVAFVETQEHGRRLPLFLDETLGTSDDVRARAIIEAVLALAEEGRQVFYFTAQSDEVARWAEVLRERGVEHRIVDLARVRALPAHDSRLLGAGVSRFELAHPPSPEGHTHESYGLALGVPPLRLGDRATAAHLWYVVHDCAALHRLLTLGFRSWGQLAAAPREQVDALLSAFPGAHARAVVLARALDVLCELRSIGHGAPVTREVLVAAGAVSGTMLDRVSELAGSVDGSAARLLEALRSGQVPRFRAKAIEELEQFLEECGCLDRREPVPIADIRPAMHVAVARDVERGVIAHEDVDRLFRLALGDSSGVPDGGFSLGAPGAHAPAPRG